MMKRYHDGGENVVAHQNPCNVNDGADAVCTNVSIDEK